MQFAKIDNNLIDYVFDKSKLKQGIYSRYQHKKIMDPKHISRNKVDYLLIYLGILKMKLLNKKVFFKKRWKFITPFPEPKVLN